jgi:uncharacterized membrane protein YozB (DUF420 family)
MKDITLWVIGIVLASAFLVVVNIAFQAVSQKWEESQTVRRFHLQLWLRLAVLGVIIGFVVYAFLPFKIELFPYQSILK